MAVVRSGGGGVREDNLIGEAPGRGPCPK